MDKRVQLEMKQLIMSEIARHVSYLCVIYQQCFLKQHYATICYFLRFVFIGNFDGIRSRERQINTPVTSHQPTSCENVRNATGHISNDIAKHQLAC